MQKFSLRKKIFLIGFTPLLLFFALVCVEILNAFYNYTAAQSARHDVRLISALSAVIHETQKERGKSSAYSSGGMALSDLEAQWTLTDQTLNEAKVWIPQSTLSPEFQMKLADLINQYPSDRLEIKEKRWPVQKVLTSYTEKIRQMLTTFIHITQQVHFEEVTATLRSLSIIEEAKESGGRLRANLSSILSTNGAINDQQFTTLLRLKAGVDTNVDSPGLVLDTQGNQLLTNFKTSPQWAEVTATFTNVIKKSESGNYGYEVKKFFTTITEALDLLMGVITHQKNQIDTQLDVIVQRAQIELLWYSLLLFTLLSGITLLITILTRQINRSLAQIVSDLITETKQMTIASHEIAQSAQSLSESSQKQATGLQQTVSSVVEINSMIAKNADAAQNSKDISLSGQQTVQNGQGSVEDMMLSINEIGKSNQDVLIQMEESNKKISEIVNLISEIGDKTRIINDIVFQTRLLSFNASVEAARAGEHGKGFAVVAEEVGKLAAMSGKSADEISNMLSESIAKVQMIIDDTKIKVGQLVERGAHSIQDGHLKAQKCQTAFTEILANVSKVHHHVSDIAMATKEQSLGVQEINRAMEQLDQITHQNNFVAKKTSQYATALGGQANTLDHVVKQLQLLVTGEDPQISNTSSSQTTIIDDDVFEWKASYSVGIPSIDQQHMRLVQLTNDLYQMMKRGSSKSELDKLIAELVSYTQTHFQYEEQLMATHHYPQFKEHQKAHQTFILQVTEFLKEMEQGGIGVSSRIFKFLQDWLIHHILHSDSLYAPYLQQKKVS